MIQVIWGYARVSTVEQNLDRQIEALHNQGIDDRHIITDKASGKDTARPGYQLLVTQLLRSGDVLMIKELDRLSRNYEQLKTEWKRLLDAGIEIVVLDTPILSTKNKSNLEKQLIASIIFELFAYLAEKERQKIHARQREGIDAARKAGKHLGRPRILLPSNWDIETRKWLAKEQTAVETMHHLGLSRSVFYKFANEKGLRIQVVNMDNGNRQ